MKNYVIAIGREYASGGGEIAEKLSRELDIKVYDKEMISLAAKKSGLAESVVAEVEQKRTSSFIYNFYMTSITLPLSDQVFMTQAHIIKELANKESCIIMGRCADYVLRDNPNCLSVFIHASLKDRIERAKNEYGITIDKPAEYIKKIDKQRAAYYRYFTDNTWGMASNYDLSINSRLGTDSAAEIIKSVALKFHSN